MLFGHYFLVVNLLESVSRDILPHRVVMSVENELYFSKVIIIVIN